MMRGVIFTRLNGDGLVDHALQIGVVTHFDMTRDGEVLAEGVPNETVVGQNATQIGVAIKHDAVQIKRFPLIPQR